MPWEVARDPTHHPLALTYPSMARVLTRDDVSSHENAVRFEYVLLVFSAHDNARES